ncbi:MAG: MarR family transcriptional regulator [Fulvivirga sp.]
MEEPYAKYSFLLDRTARRVKQYAQTNFKNLGLNITVDQWLIIRSLYEHNDLNQKEIAQMVNKDTPTLTRIIDLLCKKGLAIRKPHLKDRRCFIVHLTDDGRNAVENMLPSVKDIRMKAWEGLSKDDFVQFQYILNTIYKNLE